MRKFIGIFVALLAAAAPSLSSAELITCRVVGGISCDCSDGTSNNTMVTKATCLDLAIQKNADQAGGRQTTMAQRATAIGDSVAMLKEKYCAGSCRIDCASKVVFPAKPGIDVDQMKLDVAAHCGTSSAVAPAAPASSAATTSISTSTASAASQVVARVDTTICQKVATSSGTCICQTTGSECNQATANHVCGMYALTTSTTPKDVEACAKYGISISSSSSSAPSGRGTAQPKCTKDKQDMDANGGCDCSGVGNISYNGDNMICALHSANTTAAGGRGRAAAAPTDNQAAKKKTCEDSGGGWLTEKTIDHCDCDGKKNSDGLPLKANTLRTQCVIDTATEAAKKKICGDSGGDLQTKTGAEGNTYYECNCAGKKNSGGQPLKADLQRTKCVVDNAAVTSANRAASDTAVSASDLTNAMTKATDAVNAGDNQKFKSAVDDLKKAVQALKNVAKDKNNADVKFDTLTKDGWLKTAASNLGKALQTASNGNPDLKTATNKLVSALEKALASMSMTSLVAALDDAVLALTDASNVLKKEITADANAAAAAAKKKTCEDSGGEWAGSSCNCKDKTKNGKPLKAKTLAGVNLECVADDRAIAATNRAVGDTVSSAADLAKAIDNAAAAVEGGDNQKLKSAADDLKKAVNNLKNIAKNKNNADAKFDALTKDAGLKTSAANLGNALQTASNDNVALQDAAARLGSAMQEALAASNMDALVAALDKAVSALNDASGALKKEIKEQKAEQKADDKAFLDAVEALIKKYKNGGK